jgi:hypothetical protein
LIWLEERTVSERLGVATRVVALTAVAFALAPTPLLARTR